MHTYSKSGLRKDKLQNDKRIKKGVKEFYVKLAQINDLAGYLKTLETPVTEENIDEVVTPLIGRELDSMEKNIILMKLNDETPRESEIK